LARSTNAAPWLVLIHQLPSKPDYLRVRVRRELRQLGAAALKNSVYVIPATARNRAALNELVRDILGRRGEAVVWEARLVEGLTDGAIEDLFRSAGDREYAAIATQAKRLASELRRLRASDGAGRRRAGQAIERLRGRFDQALARDPFVAPGRESAAGLLSLAEDLAQGVEQANERSSAPATPPRGATWVTRTGVMVDRIASAWLIRRFIDASARFKFVMGRAHRSEAGEIGFDMAGAAYTHHGGRCTFEVLIERFNLRDSALRPIAEIVHDLDLEDERHGRKEAAGISRMIVGLAIATPRDDERIARGGVIFDHLYESFRRQS
jgi:hypothetical protein